MGTLAYGIFETAKRPIKRADYAYFYAGTVLTGNYRFLIYIIIEKYDGLRTFFKRPISL